MVKILRLVKTHIMNFFGILDKETPAKLEDVLAYNNGKVAVVIDAKEAHIFYSKYRNNLCNILNGYAKVGEIMLQSFNPILMLNIKSRLKGVLTGQLICRGKTIMETFRTRKTIAYSYERIVSLICFISATDVINMENHSDAKWRMRVGKHFNNLNLCSFSNTKNIISRIVDKIQRKIVKTASYLAKKPVLVYTIADKDELEQMKEIDISNYIADYSYKGIEGYIRNIKVKENKMK